MATTLLYFAALRDAVGTQEETIDLTLADISVAALIDRLRQRGTGYEIAFADMTRVRVAIDTEMASLDAPVHGAREIAFFPPVTGG